MADNYLERRMDDYRAGRLAPKSKGPAHSLKDALVLRYQGMSVFVYALRDTPLLRSLLSALTSVGVSAGFYGLGDKEGMEIAQRSGARFYPRSIGADEAQADFAERKGAPAHVVSLGGGDFPHTLTIDPDIDSPDAVARLAVFMMHPSQSLLLPAVARTVFSGDYIKNTVKNS